MSIDQLAQVVTTEVDGSRRRYLSMIGPVKQLTWSFVMPGGCDQMSCTLLADVRLRTDAMNPGRLVKVIRGAQVVWSGTLLEPSPNSDGSGWAVTAQGSGTYGANFVAHYTGKWDANVPDNAINLAIGRGLNWVNPGINSVPNLFTGTPTDSSMQTIADLLNGCCINGGLTWYVSQKHDGNYLSVFPIPTTPNRLLVSTTPVGRSIGADYNGVWLRYVSDVDHPTTGVVSSFADVEAVAAEQQAIYGPMETFADLSSVGGGTIAMSSSYAQDIGKDILAKYQRASFAGPFDVQPGQLLTMGGQPVDLGMEQAGGVCKLILTDFAYGGEVIAGRGVSFPVGAYSYDEDTGSAQITPFQSLFTSFPDLLSQMVSLVRPEHNRDRDHR